MSTASAIAPSSAVRGGTNGTKEVRCHRCSAFVGESPEALELVGVVKEKELREKLPDDRRSWRCKCGWTSVFRLALAQLKSS